MSSVNCPGVNCPESNVLESNVGQPLNQFVLGHSSDSLTQEEGDCLVMQITLGLHEGWHRALCNGTAYFICEKSKWNFKLKSCTMKS